MKRAVFGEPPGYAFGRIEPQNDMDRVRNLIEYTKTSESRYAAPDFSAAYHTLRIHGLEIRGQRDPAQRLRSVPIDFAGKTLLDIGCNQGGMLFAVQDQLAQGIGIDYDSRMINAANRIRRLGGTTNLDFYIFDLEHEPLKLISDFLPGGRADIVFLLSVCMWISNWRDVIDFGSSVAQEMLFESNGTDEQQREQEAHLRNTYRNVSLLSSSSEDDPRQRRRRLFHAC